MRLEFVADVKPAPGILQRPNGRLLYFGTVGLTWDAVADLLACDKIPVGLRGDFALVWQGRDETLAFVDHVANYPLFYSQTHISNIFAEVLKTVPQPQRNRRIELQMELLGGQSIGEETTEMTIRRLQPGHYLRNGRQIRFLDLLNYSGDTELDKARLTELVEHEVLQRNAPRSVLLFSGGTDSTTLAGISRKLNLNWSFVHAYSEVQPLTETAVVDRTSQEMDLRLAKVRVDYSGDIVPQIRDRQFSFWIENPFPAKWQALQLAGFQGARIFTGEIGDQLFGGPKNSAVLNYALQTKTIRSEDVATLWVNLSASYGKSASLQPCLKIEDLCNGFPEAREVFRDLRDAIAAQFEAIPSRDFLHRLLLLNYVIKGPYRTWAYAQDEWDWVHPFAAWKLFDYCFQVRSADKIAGGGVQKSVLLDLWRAYVSPLPWRLPKHGLGIPPRFKLRSASRDLGH